MAGRHIFKSLPLRNFMKDPFISIQILNYNGKKFLKGCLDSLLKLDYSNYEVVVVDNASTDDSLKFVNNLYKKEIKNKNLRILKLKKNYGVTGGYNRSYASTKADYILILNNDTKILMKSFLKQLLKTIKTRKAAMVGAVSLPFEFTKSNEDDLKKMKNPTLTVLGFAIADAVKEESSPVANGCCVLVDKAQIKSPIFPEEYFCYGEDVFLGWKAFLEGKKNIFDRDAVFLHYGSGTSEKRSYFTRYHAEKNRIANLLIFLERKTLIKLFPLFLLENLAKSIYFIRSPKLFRAFFDALIWNIQNYKIIKKYRRQIQDKRKFNDEKLISFMSHKIIPEYTPGVSSYAKVLNTISKIYLRAVNLKTYD